MSDPGAVVDDLQNGVGPGPAHHHADFGFVRAVLDRVVEQVEHGLAQCRPVGDDIHLGVRDDRDLLTLLLGEHVEVGRDLARQFGEAEGNRVEIGAAGVCAREQQQAVRHRRQALGLFEDRSDCLPVLRLAAALAQADLADAADGGERGAKLVRGIRGEAAERVEGALEAGERIVDDAGQLPEFVGRVLDRQPLLETVGRNLPGAGRHRRDGRQRAPGQEIARSNRDGEREREAEAKHGGELAELLPGEPLAAAHPDVQRLSSGGGRPDERPHVMAVGQTQAGRQARPGGRRPRRRGQTGLASPLEHTLALGRPGIHPDDVVMGIRCGGRARRRAGRRRSHRAGQILLQPLHGERLIAAELPVERLVHVVAHLDQHGHGVDRDDHQKGEAVPEGQPRANASRPAHASSSRTTNPTPRTVWMIRVPGALSTLRRSRMMCTSMTLSSGVPRDGSRHTSRAI